jgi:asparaginyl-tRNA synthetase
MSKHHFITIQQAIAQGEGEASLRGWVYRERESNKFKFIVLRDGTNIIQTVVKKEEVSEQIWNDAVKLQVEASIIVKGVLKRDERAPTGVELNVRELTVVGTSDQFPITKDQSIEFLADNRHLWLRSRQMNAMLKIRATAFRAFREYFDKHDFIEYHSPMFQATQAEGGSSLFSVKYFNTQVYLSQTWQLYAEPAIQSYEKIYTIAPCFRAEKSVTSRHLTELWMAEMEVAWAEFTDIQNYGEGVVKHIVKSVLEHNALDLQTLGRDAAKLRPTVDKPFPRMTYTDVLKLLKEKFDMDIEWGKDLRTIEEDKLSSLFDLPVIVTEYPAVVKAFYMKEVPGHPEVVQGCDFIGPEGYGELIGGSERETDIEVLKKKLIAQGEDPENYQYYLDTRRYGSVPHGGFGMGMERIISWICGFETIKDAIPFPRTPARWTP